MKKKIDILFLTIYMAVSSWIALGIFYLSDI